jgi:uncharacterized membrane protein
MDAISLTIMLKFVHVVAAIVAIGANVTYAFWLRRAGRDRERLVWTINAVRALDRRLANPGYIVVLITGLLMVAAGLYSFTTGWIVAAIVLYVVVALLGFLAFAPAIRRQLAEAERDPTSAAYEAAARRSNIMGIVTTAIALVIVYLMIAKPF